jgi:hypothetical protein
MDDYHTKVRIYKILLTVVEATPHPGTAAFNE